MMDPPFSQEINFKGSEIEFSVGVISQDVRIKCSAGDHDHGSSKMKLTDVVDFNFGLRLCPGHLIAIHRTGQYIAYGLMNKDVGMVRIINTVTKEKTLIKGVRGLIYDIAFAFCTAEILLSFVDEQGMLFVHEILRDEATTEMTHRLVVQLAAPHAKTRITSDNSSCGSRVTWCPYVPSYGEDEASCAEHSKLLVLLRLGGSAEVVDIGELARSKATHINLDDPGIAAAVDGYVRLDECHSSVVDASFSPDGTALATAGLDGYVKFFQVFLRDGERPRCLHEWRPHNGKALSSLLFLDNINTYGTDCKFWKFAVTGAMHNTELKVWSCETWTCTQTILFHADPRATSPDLYLKACLDATGTYLVLTETNNRLLYVLQVRRDDDGQQAAVDSIAEFLLPAACISFCVRSAAAGADDSRGVGGRKKQLLERYLNDDLDDLSNMDGDEDVDDMDNDDDDDDVDKDVNIHMYLMQTKCLQECRLVFRPEMADCTTIDAELFTTSQSPVPVSDQVNVTALKLDDLQTSVQQLIIKQQLNSMTTEQHSCAEDSDTIEAGTDDNDVAVGDHGSKNDTVALADEVVVVDNLIDIDTVTADGISPTISNPPCQHQTAVERIYASGGSSPSREVEEILLSIQSAQSKQQQQQQHDASNNSCAGSSTAASTSIAVAAAAAAATFTPKQFFDSLSKLQHQQHPPQHGVATNNNNHSNSSRSSSTVVGSSQNWPDIPKVSNIELELEQQQEQQQQLHKRIESLEDVIRLHTAQLANATAEHRREQLKMRDSVGGALSAHSQHVTSLLEQHRRSLDATVQTAVAAAAKAAQIPTTVAPPVATPPVINTSALAAAVQQELKCTVAPLVQATFDQLHRSLDTQHSQKLGHLDSLLRSNVQRLFAQCAQNKSVAEALSVALVQMVRPGLEAQYRDLMATSLVPAWEKVTEAMFHQIHATFTLGTKEYCSAMERYCAEQQQQQQQVQQQVQAQVSCAFSRLEAALADVVREEVRLGLQQLCSSAVTLLQTADGGGNDNSGGGGNTAGIGATNHLAKKRAPTPAVNQMQQHQQQVKRLLQRGDSVAVCEAFQVALSAAAAASDAALVLYVCERVPVHEVFCVEVDGSSRCILPQHVLLSLIQQLAVQDLTQHTDLKHRYLEESLLALDMRSAVAREHGATVLRDLLKQLAAFLQAHPTHANARGMRMLHMVTQSYVATAASAH